MAEAVYRLGIGSKSEKADALLTGGNNGIVVESVSQVGPPSRGGPGLQPWRPHDAIPVCKVVRLGSPDLLETVSRVGPPSRGGPGASRGDRMMPFPCARWSGSARRTY